MGSRERDRGRHAGPGPDESRVLHSRGARLVKCAHFRGQTVTNGPIGPLMSRRSAWSRSTQVGYLVQQGSIQALCSILDVNDSQVTD